jgi:tripartite-type tricarboxylate transporter receptor subunit TctC
MHKQRLKGEKWVHVLVFLAVSGLIFSAGPTKLATAQDYPTRPIIINVGSTPGSVYGLVPQAFADQAKKYFKNPQPIMVNFKPGASHLIAAEYVLNQPADGYNIYVFSIDAITKLAEDPKGSAFTKDDLIPIGAMAISPLMLTVLKDRPWNTIEELIDYAKKNPGKLSYASVGVGSATHLAGEDVQESCGIKLNHIPFIGAPPALAAVLGGHVDLSLFAMGSVGEHIKPGGSMKVLAVMDNERFEPVKNVPTFLEKGYDVQWAGWMCLAVKKGTPQPIVDQLRDVFKKTMDEPGVKEAVVKVGYKPLNLGPEATKKYIDTKYASSRKFHQKIGTAK